MDVEVVGNRARDMTLEQQRQGDAGNSERDHDGHCAAGDEPQPQRVSRHPTCSGTR